MNGTSDAEIARLRAVLAETERLREQGEARLRETVRHQRNVLAVLRALVRRSGDQSDGAEHWRAMLDGRIAAFVRAQSTILRNLAEGADLENLIRDELLSFGMHPGFAIRIEGPALRLAAGAAGLMALAVHELALSAAHNGGIDGEGALDITWQAPGTAGPLRLCWTETATKPAAHAEESLDWLRDALAYDLGGALTVETEEMRRRWEVTLPRRTIIG